VRGILVAIAIVAIATAIYQAQRAHEAAVKRVAVEREQAALRARLLVLQPRLEAEQRKLANVETDNARLLEIIASGAITDALRTPKPRLTRENIDARYKRAQALERDGDVAAALAEYLWCYDTGFRRSSELLQRVTKLGEQFLPAREALRQRARTAEQRVLADTNDFETMGELIALNQALNENTRTLEIYERLADGDILRSYAARGMFEVFVTTQRYDDALRARPYEQWLGELESAIGRANPSPARDRQRAAIEAVMEAEGYTEAQKQAHQVARQRSLRAQHQAAITSTALGVEILAGAGDVAHARELGEKLLAYDGGEETRALLQKHLERAGRPELLRRSDP
jgi:hypothetical protein